MSQRRAVSSIAALMAPLDGPARLAARHCPGAIRSEQVMVALQYFRRRFGRPLIVVWDRLPAHQAKVVQAFVAAHPDDYQLEWLPAYAPELNPEELCNGAVKRELLNAPASSVEELRQYTRRSFLRLARRPTQLHGFFRHLGLDLT